MSRRSEGSPNFRENTPARQRHKGEELGAVVLTLTPISSNPFFTFDPVSHLNFHHAVDVQHRLAVPPGEGGGKRRGGGVLLRWSQTLPSRGGRGGGMENHHELPGLMRRPGERAPPAPPGGVRHLHGEEHGEGVRGAGTDHLEERECGGGGRGGGERTWKNSSHSFVMTSPGCRGTCLQVEGGAGGHLLRAGAVEVEAEELAAVGQHLPRPQGGAGGGLGEGVLAK